MAAPVLYLLVPLGRDRYLLAASQVVEVIPRIRLKLLRGAPAGTAGLMNYRGAAVPVVDLAEVATATVTPTTDASRIIVARYVDSSSSASNLIGLLVPEVRETLSLDPDAFVTDGMAVDGAPSLGSVLATPDGILQCVTVSALLTPALRDALFRVGTAA